jgi:hypothetical protein
VYATIAPLMLGFASIGIGLFYLAYRYNILFVSDSPIDTKGLIYPLALEQLMTGVYLGLLVMIGLFAIATAVPALVLTIVFLVGVVLMHLAVRSALHPLLHNLPRSLELEEAELRAGHHASITANDTSDSLPRDDLRADLTHDNLRHDNLRHNTDGIHADNVTDDKLDSLSDHPTAKPAPHRKPNFLTKFVRPEIYADHATLRRLVPPGRLRLASGTDAAEAYLPPSVRATTPLVWVPRDASGVSAEECRETGRVLPMTDHGATLNDKGRVCWDAEGERPPLWREKIWY